MASLEPHSPKPSSPVLLENVSDNEAEIQPESTSQDEPVDMSIGQSSSNNANNANSANSSGSGDTQVDSGAGPSNPKRLCRGPRGPCANRRPVIVMSPGSDGRSPSPVALEDWSGWTSSLSRENYFSSLDANRWTTRSWHR